MAYFNQTPTLSGGSLVENVLPGGIAGSDGFIKLIPAGEFQGKLGVDTGGGKYRRAYFFGVVLNNGAVLSDQGGSYVADIQNHAQLMQRLGINCVRTHYIDNQGLFTSGSDSKTLVSGGLIDKLDRAIYEWKQRGIYTLLEVYNGHTFVSGDGVNAAAVGLVGYPFIIWDNQANDVFDTLKVRIKNLMDHVGAQTGVAYKDEKAICAVQILNEMTLIKSWADNTYGTQWVNGGANIPTYYRDTLNTRFRSWLQSAAKYNNIIQSLRDAWADQTFTDFTDPDIYVINGDSTMRGSTNANRVRDTAEYLMYLQRDYIDRMTTYLKTTVGCQQLVLGGNADYFAFQPTWYANASADIVGTNAYQGHPNLATYPPDGPADWLDVSIIPSSVNTGTIQNRKMLPRLAAGQGYQKAHFVAEFNMPWFVTTNYECLPMVTAYGSLHDWDAIFLHSWEATSHLTNYGSPGGPRLASFDTIQNPVRRSQLPIATLIFRRRDVSPAREVRVDNDITGSDQTDLTEMSRLGHGMEDESYRAYAARTSGATIMPDYGYARRRISHQFTTAGAGDLNWASRWPDADHSTGTTHVARGLTLDTANLIWKINTRNTQGACGRLNGQTITLDEVTLSSINPGFEHLSTGDVTLQHDGGAILVTSADHGRSIAASSRILISACGHLKTNGWAVAGTIDGHNNNGNTRSFANTAAWGATNPPQFQCEAATFTVQITRREPSFSGLSATCTALDANGNGVGTVSVTKVESGAGGTYSRTDTMTINTDTNDSMLYLLTF